MQCGAVACAVASIIIIFVAKGWEPGSHRLFDIHKVLGMVVTALAVVQIGVGMGRPDLKSPKRPWWRGGHYTIGWTTLLGGEEEGGARGGGAEGGRGRMCFYEGMKGNGQSMECGMQVVGRSVGGCSGQLCGEQFVSSGGSSSTASPTTAPF
jgi:hypothetical protein